MSERSFDTIYNNYSRLVYWAAYKVVSNHEAAEDITQSVFERVIHNFKKINELEEAQIKSWLYRTATNLAIDMVRKSSKELLSDEPLDDGVVDFGELPDEVAVERQRSLKVKKAIDKLDEIYRQVVMLHYFSEMTVREISENTNISEGTIKSRLVRARALLAEELRDEVSIDG